MRKRKDDPERPGCRCFKQNRGTNSINRGMTEMTKKFDVQSLREKVMTSDDVKYDSVYVEAWDAELPVRTLTAADMKKVMKHKDDSIRMMILAILYGCETEEGEKVFREEDLAIFETKKGMKEIGAVAQKILALSGMKEEAAQEAKN